MESKKSAKPKSRNSSSDDSTSSDNEKVENDEISIKEQLKNANNQIKGLQEYIRKIRIEDAS